MKLHIYIFYVCAFKLLLVSKCNSGKIINRATPVNQQVTFELTENLIKSCFNGTKKNFIYLSDHGTDDSFVLNSLYSSVTPVYLFETNSHGVFDAHKRYRNFTLNERHLSVKNDLATDVAIITPSNTVLQTILECLRNSIWWNHEALFLIVNKNLNDGCRVARSFLSTIWAFNILSAIYLCHDSERQVVLYTFNPYTSLAPEFWSKSEDNHLSDWTLFQHALESSQDTESLFAYNSSFCGNIYFDKTRNLNGYNLKAYLFNPELAIKFDSNHCMGRNPRVMCTIWNHMNAKVTTKSFNDTGFMNERGEPRGPLKDLVTGVLDSSIKPSFLRGFWKEQAYPFHVSSLKIVSLKDLSKLHNTVAHNFSLKALLFFMSASVGSIIILKHILEQTVSSAVLEAVRMLVSASTLNNPRTLYGKILLITLVIANFAISTFLLSCLSAFITVSERSPLVDSAEDLIKSNLSIYGLTSHKEIIWHKEIRDRYHEIHTVKECTDRLLKGDHVACICVNLWLKRNLYETSTIHVSTNDLASRAYAQLFAYDSPLRYKFTWCLLKMSEGGFTNFQDALDHMHALKNHDDTDDFEVFTIADLIPSSTILIGGWALATIALSIEIIIYTIGKRHDITGMFNFVFYDRL